MTNDVKVKKGQIWIDKKTGDRMNEFIIKKYYKKL